MSVWQLFGSVACLLSARLVSYMVLAESRAGVARGTEPTPRSAAVHAGLQIYWFYMDTREALGERELEK